MLRGKIPLVKTGAVAVVLLLSTSCGLFTVKEPYERWRITLTYKEEDRRVLATPDSFEVHGPRGEILVHNSTEAKRGFKIEGLGVAAGSSTRELRPARRPGEPPGSFRSSSCTALTPPPSASRRNRP